MEEPTPPSATNAQAAESAEPQPPSINLPLRELSEQAESPEDGVQKEQTPVKIGPLTDPEHGDLTPDYVRWYLHNHTYAEALAKYGARADKLPPDCELV